MNVEEIRAAYYMKPFQPFFVCLTDGRKLRVPRRNYIGISPIGDGIVVAHKDSFEYIKIANVTMLEPTKKKTKKSDRHRA